MPLSVSIWSAGPLAVGHAAIARLRPFTGCLQPGQTSSVYADALSRLSDRLHYLNTSGDRVRTPRASGSTLAPTRVGKWKARKPLSRGNIPS